MPKSRRDKVVALTKTKKKGRVLKENRIEQIHEACDKYPYVYVFDYSNMRNTTLQAVRQEWKGSKFFFGKNKLTIHAMGRNPESEYKDNLYLLGKVNVTVFNHGDTLQFPPNAPSPVY